VKRRRNGKKRKSKIQNPTLERHETLEQALNEGMATSGLHGCRLKVFYKGALQDSGLPLDRGLPIVIGILDPQAFCECIWQEAHLSIEPYIRERFGSGIFEVGFYDENNSELGRYRYHIGGAPEYIHSPKASDDEDSEPKDPAIELFMMLFREHFLGEDDYFLEEDEI